MSASASGRKRSLAFVTDIVTPYTIAVMTELAGLAELTVLFSTATSGRGQAWTFPDLPFRHVVVGGLTRRRADADLSDYYLSPRVLIELARCSPDAIIAAGWSFPTYYAALYARARRRALIIHSDGSSHTEQSISALQRFSRRMLVPLSDGFAPNTRPAAARFRELGARPDQLHCAPHSTNLGPFWNVEPIRDGLAEVRVLGAGRLIPRKGFDRLIAAFADARSAEPRLKLQLVGTGPEYDRLRAQARGLGDADTTFTGFVDQSRLADLYANSHIFAFPSLREEFGFVLLEAMAAGLPCVASPHAGATQDLIHDGENGVVADPNDQQSWTRALLALARDPDLRRRLGETARRDSRRRTPLATAEAYLAGVEASLARRGAGRKR